MSRRYTVILVFDGDSAVHTYVACVEAASVEAASVDAEFIARLDGFTGPLVDAITYLGWLEEAA